MKRFFPPPNPEVSSSKGPETCLKNPISPSKIGEGPVIPCAASIVEKTAFLAALAKEAPFHSESSPALTCLIAMCALSEMLTEWVSFCLGRPIIFPAARALETSP